MYAQNTPKRPSPTQNTPFPGLNLKVGKMNYRLGKMDPNWAKCLKRRQNLSKTYCRRPTPLPFSPRAARRLTAEHQNHANAERTGERRTEPGERTRLRGATQLLREQQNQAEFKLLKEAGHYSQCRASDITDVPFKFLDCQLNDTSAFTAPNTPTVGRKLHPSASRRSTADRRGGPSSSPQFSVRR